MPYQQVPEPDTQFLIELWQCGKCPAGFTFLDGILYDNGDLWACEVCGDQTPDYSDLIDGYCRDCDHERSRGQIVYAGRP